MTIQSYSPTLLPLKVIATGAALPPNRVESSTLDSLLRKPAGYVEKRSGISYRFHAADDASQAELAVAALHDALTRCRIDAQSIDLLISASAISVQALPCTAAHILKVAGLAPGTAGFDINSSCVSFISAMQVAAGLLNAGTYRRIAIVSADLASRGIDWEHEESSLIFGDGAACAIVERGDGSSGILASLVETYPEGSDLCEIRAGGTRRNPRAGMNNSDFLFHMQGKKLFRQASALIEDYLARLLAASGLTLAQIATVVPHQASHLSLEHMRKRLHVSADVLVDIYRYHGNQVAASIPTALHAAVTEGRFNPGKPVMLIGTAAGLSLAGMVLLP
ncbi:3-oxoacyl-[acyl-carrier-protein] synthase III C-terminal domain-containing protein [Pseudomonas lundensis]|uniref:3-oxoacyl-[acyl-carrier-protein] synthase III C-terminal domain-containing protein n=1 Tax=Serratia proteamaculans TaxID=28151 RepID=UPI00298162D0|nr:3-oxoacyl-[acyl-carrier-protein] synthase III C-terminal domain-containing protein [Serratia proteamaculans]MDW5498645.1 3-oxoacyl-[acyl-carrier-protein] synthase III C-terminal domain-containing protein [Serratia proteamaculans]MDW5503703.1 3-oxoacyl-[acyl-carrier-protein] synthase III C-terminal domain-containing protein [Pseudomonas lundensis]